MKTNKFNVRITKIIYNSDVIVSVRVSSLDVSSNLFIIFQYLKWFAAKSIYNYRKSKSLSRVEICFLRNIRRAARWI